MRWVLLLLISTQVMAEPILLKESCNKIPKGAICYNDLEQTKLDNALKSGVKCKVDLLNTKKKLNLCISEPIQDERIIPPLKEDDQHHWIFMGMATFVALALGIGVGSGL